MSIDGLPHTWGQTFVSGGDVLVRVYGGALNVNGHLGGGGYLPDPGYGSNDTHLPGILPVCRHDFCLENDCYNLLLQGNCQMSNQNREINNLHEGGKSSICITTHRSQIVLPDVFSLGSKKKEKKFEIMRNNG